MKRRMIGLLFAVLLLCVFGAGCADRTAAKTEAPPEQTVTEPSAESSEPSEEKVPDPPVTEDPKEEQAEPVAEEPEKDPNGQSEKQPAGNETPPQQTTTPPKQETTPPKQETTNPTPKPPEKTASVTGEVKGIWISYLDFWGLLQNEGKAGFTANMRNAYSQIVDLGLNTVFVQVRPFGDAIYPSEYFPWSSVCTGTEGVDPGFDPLQILCDLAGEYGLRIEAWINPYRIRTNLSGGKEISSDNIAGRWHQNGNPNVIEYDNGLYYNPAREEVRQRITDGVLEILENYDVDGIHFDDYFYPTTDKAFDAGDYADYTASGGTLSLGDWRRENVNKLVRKVYAAVKAYDPNLVFGISPQGNLSNNYNVQFVDVELWMANPGYVDYICPQIYYGFHHKSLPYAETVETWNGLIRADSVDLYIGLAAYKIGTEEGWDGAGEMEWVNNHDRLARMVQTARKASRYAGFALYRYDSLINPADKVRAAVAEEKDALREIL